MPCSKSNTDQKTRISCRRMTLLRPDRFTTCYHTSWPHWSNQHRCPQPSFSRTRPNMSTNRPLGGIIHTYQKYDPVEFPSPTAEPPDLVSPVMEHMLFYGAERELTEEELARAV